MDAFLSSDEMVIKMTTGGAHYDDRQRWTCAWATHRGSGKHLLLPCLVAPVHDRTKSTD